MNGPVLDRQGLRRGADSVAAARRDTARSGVQSPMRMKAGRKGRGLRQMDEGPGLWTGPFWCLARPEGFEPPTPWFVARYSIQMSYGRVAEIVLSLKSERLFHNALWRARKDSNLLPPGS